MKQTKSVAVSPAAAADFDAIAAHVSENSGANACWVLLDRIHHKLNSLGSMPLRFPLTELTSEPLRRCQCDRWHIFYSVDEHVEIVRIIHQSRDLTAEAFN